MAKVSSSGIITAVGGGTTIITVDYADKKKKDRKITVIVPKEVDRQTALKPFYDAMEVQQKWSWNACYRWTSPTIANSKTQGTCITMPSVAAQRCGLIPSGSYLTGESGKVASYTLYQRSLAGIKKKNVKYWTTKWQPGGVIKNMIAKGEILPGDILNSYYHTFVYAGKKNGELRWNESGHAGSHKAGTGIATNRTSLWQKNNANANAKCVALFRINVFDVTTSCKNGTITATRPWMAGQTVTITYKPRMSIFIVRTNK